jgi:hypothetical protein
MTFARRVAGKISRAVVRYASPGCKEWAEGLAREAEFISSDWVALWWAMGSTKVLFNRREAPLRSLADVAGRARRFSEVQRRGGTSNCLPLLFAFIYLLRLRDSGGGLETLGCWLVIVGGLLMGVAGLVRWQQRIPPPLSQDPVAWAIYYRVELERLRENARSVLGMAVRVGFLVYWVGLMLAQKGGARAHPPFTGFAMVMLVLLTPALIREGFKPDPQIEEVDAVLGETH